MDKYEQEEQLRKQRQELESKQLSQKLKDLAQAEAKKLKLTKKQKTTLKQQYKTLKKDLSTKKGRKELYNKASGFFERKAEERAKLKRSLKKPKGRSTRRSKRRSKTLRTPQKTSSFFGGFEQKSSENDTFSLGNGGNSFNFEDDSAFSLPSQKKGKGKKAKDPFDFSL